MTFPPSTMPRTMPPRPSPRRRSKSLLCHNGGTSTLLRLLAFLLRTAATPGRRFTGLHAVRCSLTKPQTAQPSVCVVRLSTNPDVLDHLNLRVYLRARIRVVRATTNVMASAPSQHQQYWSTTTSLKPAPAWQAPGPAPAHPRATKMARARGAAASQIMQAGQPVVW